MRYVIGYRFLQNTRGIFRRIFGTSNKEMLLKLRKIMMVSTLLYGWCELDFRDSQ